MTVSPTARLKTDSDSLEGLSPNSKPVRRLSRQLSKMKIGSSEDEQAMHEQSLSFGYLDFIDTGIHEDTSVKRCVLEPGGHTASLAIPIATS